MPVLSVRKLAPAWQLLVAWCLVASVCRADVSPSCGQSLRPCDSLWLVSTREYPCGDPRLHVDDLTYRRFEESTRWQSTTLSDLLATDSPTTTTVIWVHGNRFSSSDALNEGWETYRALIRCSTCQTPVRFIIFSWPSERIGGDPLDDVRVKAARTCPNAYYLAWLIDQMGDEVPVSLVGYSFGARISTGALHLLGGGELNGKLLSERRHPERMPLRVVLAAAGVDNHWLIPGHYHGNASSQISRLTILYNSCDRVLKRYHLLYCARSNAVALGYSGLAGINRLGLERTAITQMDACCYVAKFHSWGSYLASGALIARIRAGVLPASGAVADSGK